MSTEKRLIDANAIVNGIALYLAENAYINDTAQSALEMVAKWVSEAHTVDAVEVVHGRWIVDAVEVDHPFLEFESVWRDVHQCSICKEYFDVSDARNYCPNCGAKMDLEV